MNDKIEALWKLAAEMDASLRVRSNQLPALQEKRITASGYSRARLFSRMAKGQISLLGDFSVPLPEDAAADKQRYLFEHINAGFPKLGRARTQTGRSRTQYKMRIPELMGRWKRGRAILGVTDLHFRGTTFDRAIDTTPLSDFNIFCDHPELMDKIEMMTLVVSSPGNVTDSHADDCDGSNHCFLGKKLWLAWDRLEGKAKGLQDADRDWAAINGRAVFDMATFLSLPSARWFTVEENETLFLPGSMAHKVVTLEHYLGVGSFHVALPSYVRSLRRWIVYDTLDIEPKKLLNKINRAVLQKLSELKSASEQVKEHWGLSYMRQANKAWERSESPETKASLLNHPTFAAFIKAAAGN